MALDQKTRNTIERSAKNAADALFKEFDAAFHDFQTAPTNATSINLRVIARKFRGMQFIREYEQTVNLVFEPSAS